MINITDDLQFIGMNNDPSEQIAKTLQAYLAVLNSKHGNAPQANDSLNYRMMEQYAFQRYAERCQLSNAKTLSRLVKNCCCEKRPNIEKCREIISLQDANDHELKGFIYYFRAFVILLWKDRICIPPINFEFYPYSKLLGGLPAILDKDLLAIVSGAPKETVRNKMARFLFLTDWKSASDIDLNEIWIAIRDANVNFSKMGCSPIAFARAALACPDAPYTNEDVSILSRFSAAAARLSRDHPLKRMDFEGLKIHASTSFVSGNQTHYGKQDEYDNRKIKRSREAHGREDIESELSRFAEINDFENYFSALARKRKLDITAWVEPSHYTGRSSFDFSQDYSEWISCYSYFVRSLKGSKGHIKSKSTSIAVLLDYVLCYLPWWKESHKSFQYSLPYKPSQFKRVIFWKNDLAKAASIDLPMSAIDFYKMRRSMATFSPWVNACHDFFEFIRTEMPGMTEIGVTKVECNFSNPVNPDLDREGEGVKKPTDKIAFPIRVMPTVIATFKAIEETLFALQKRVISGEVTITEPIGQIKKSENINLDRYDLSLKVEVPGQPPITINTIPNIVTWVKVKLAGRPEERAVVPFLSVIRMLRVTLHSGQRMQNIQWLDLNSFDKYMTDDVYSTYFCPLFLCVDKVDPGRTPLVPNFVMETLIREKAFQMTELLTPPVPVYYEGNPSSGYDKIVPLFRNPAHNDQHPFLDDTYRLTWVKILKFIEDIYNTHFSNGDVHRFINQEEDGTLTAIHTPHSMRNTYILYRKELVDIQLLIKQTGHTERVALHYAQAQPRKQLEELLEKADQIIESGGCGDFHGASHASLFESNFCGVANSLNSSIRQGIAHNRAETIDAQRMISINLPDVSNYEGDNGLKRLKIQQDTQIAFFSECVCPMGGLCPKEVMGIIEESKRCGLCPLACFGIDHLPGILAKTRKLSDSIALGQKQLAIVEGRNLGSDISQKLKSQIRLNALEASALLTIAKVLRKARENAMNSSYIARKPDLVEKAVEISIDQNTEAERFLSRLADANQFPEFINDNFMTQIERMARRICHEFPGMEDNAGDDISVVSSYVASIMRNKGITLGDLSATPEIRFLSNMR